MQSFVLPVTSTWAKGLFTPNHSVAVTVALTGGTFDIFDEHYEGQNGLHTYFCPST